MSAAITAAVYRLHAQSNTEWRESQYKRLARVHEQNHAHVNSNKVHAYYTCAKHINKTKLSEL